MSWELYIERRFTYSNQVADKCESELEKLSPQFDFYPNFLSIMTDLLVDSKFWNTYIYICINKIQIICKEFSCLF